MLYSLVLYPLSLLPLRFLHCFRRAIYFMLRFIVSYRKKVILKNLTIAFPESTVENQKQLLAQSYWHLSNLLVEGIKNLSIEKRELMERISLDNPELFERLYKENKHVIILSSHIENWEFFITAQGLLLPHRAFGIGKKIQKGNLNQQINRRRERFGMRVIHSSNYKNVLEKELKGKPMAILTLSDQSPSRKNAFWTPFFNRTTAFAFGGEFMAHEYGMAVVYLVIDCLGAGRYQARTELICDDGRTMGYGEITRRYAALLERDIKGKPESWLWSHKRWKHEVPENLKAVSEEHQKRFVNRFGQNIVGK